MRKTYALILAIMVAAPTPVLAQDLPPGPGSDLTTQVCSACHEPSMFSGQRHDRAGWKSIVNTMVSNGAQANAQQQDQIVDYLANAFPASGSMGSDAMESAAPAQPQ